MKTYALNSVRASADARDDEIHDEFLESRHGGHDGPDEEMKDSGEKGTHEECHESE
jgi:hypothetical protein